MRNLTKIFTCVVVLALGVTPIAQAGRKAPKKVTRTQTIEYTGLGGIEVAGSGGTVCVSGFECITLMPARGEEYLALEGEDSSGTATPIRVNINGSPTIYCGHAEEIWIGGAIEVEIDIPSISTTCAGSVGTTGTLTATYSNLP
jgi:hypothetical protein